MTPSTAELIQPLIACALGVLALLLVRHANRRARLPAPWHYCHGCGMYHRVDGAGRHEWASKRALDTRGDRLNVIASPYDICPACRTLERITRRERGVV